jgi:hypothetical protein
MQEKIDDLRAIFGMQEKTKLGFLPSLLIGLGIGLVGCILLAMAVMFWTH